MATWGNVTGSNVLSPYGQKISSNTTDAYSYAGLYQDTENSSSHATFRNVSTTQGRWTRPDPYDGSYDVPNPQSMNRYVYAMNNPLGFTDPSGLMLCQDENGKFFDSGNNSCGAGSSPVQGPSTTVTVNGNTDDGSIDVITWGINTGIGTGNAGYIGAPNNGTISANNNYEGSKQQLCQHQANIAALEAILPGSSVLIGGSPGFRALNSATVAVGTDRALDAAEKSTSALKAIESFTGLPASVVSMGLEVFGYVSSAYTAYSALKAAQNEYAACMAD